MYNYITYNPEILNGKPIIKGTRLSVEFIMELFASGGTRDKILESYPQVDNEMIDEVLRYAANAVKNEIIISSNIAS
jgi:uncharacterized protein (DUF433 family)